MFLTLNYLRICKSYFAKSLPDSLKNNLTVKWLTNGKVLVTGGYNGSIYFNSAELYDPSTGTWTTTGSMNSVRFYRTASVLTNGKVLVTGGLFSYFLNSAEIYDSSTGAGQRLVT